MGGDAPPVVARSALRCFAVTCMDGPEAPGLRARDLDGHLAHVEAHWRRYIVAGPLRDPGGEALVGSLFLVLAESAEDAWALMRRDPYLTNGQYSRVDLKELTPSIGQWPGGKIWESADALRHRAAGGPAEASP